MSRQISLGVQLRTRQAQVFRMGQVVKLLEMTTIELKQHLSELEDKNPMLRLRRTRHWANAGTTDILEMTAVAQSNGLFDHVSRELAGLLEQGGLMTKVITALMAELEPSGWLGASVDEIAQSLDLNTELIETALRVVQKRIEPAGLFTRNLQECLQLQLEDQDALSPEMEKVLAALPALERGGIGEMVATTGLNAGTITACLQMLKRLDPKPGSAFVNDPTLMREPDVRLTPKGKGWEIEFLSSLEEDLEVSQLPRHGRSPTAGQALAEARALKQALGVRESALLQVVRKMVDLQAEYFHKGPEALVPMSLSDIAKATGFHLSTVSRILEGFE